MLFWHLGATTAITRYTFRDERMDLRFLMLGAILPDLVDTPIGLLWYRHLHTVRLVTHSLPFAAVVMTGVLLATRRGRPRKRWMPLAIGLLLHLFLDAMWADPATLWWPLLGWSFTADAASTVGGYLRDLFTNPVMWAGEAVGVLYLAYLWRAGQMADPARRTAFVATGRIDVPIRP